MRSRPATLAAVLVALAAAGCGRPPPQAPPLQTHKLDYSTSSISTDCGEAFEITAFPGDHAGALAPLERDAAANARRLAAVLHQNAAWIYQGADVRELVDDSLAMLRSCGLDSAAAVLAHASR